MADEPAAPPPDPVETFKAKGGETTLQRSDHGQVWIVARHEGREAYSDRHRDDVEDETLAALTLQAIDRLRGTSTP